MLGHSASFAHIHAINLTQSKNLVLKRIGYLMCSLFFDKSSDLLIMLVATILKDLTNGDVHEIVICLTSLGNIMNSTIAESITEHVVRLLGHTTDLVRKKAILVLQKIKQETGSAVPEYKDKMKKGLCDREPSVMSASLNLYLEEVRENPRKYRDLTSSFVIILKQVVEHKLPKEFDYHRMPAPWIQIKMLKILEILGKGDQKASEHCYHVLEQVLRRAEETSNNISIAITYQCVKTIASLYPNESLLSEAATVLTKYLEASSTNNMKYLGIQALGMLLRTSPKLLEDHQLIVVECLESKDETLKKETLDLLYKMTTQENVEIIVSKMLNTLHGSTDHHFRNDLVLKITELAERYCTSHDWYIGTMQILFELGSEYLSESILNNFLKLARENYEANEAFGEEIISKMVELV
jgi:AP-4 complex subunit epsilon-1